jgi:hypothetical protein
MEKFARWWRQDSQIAWSSTIPRLTGLPPRADGRETQGDGAYPDLSRRRGRSSAMSACQGQARQSRPRLEANGKGSSRACAVKCRISPNRRRSCQQPRVRATLNTSWLDDDSDEILRADSQHAGGRDRHAGVAAVRRPARRPRNSSLVLALSAPAARDRVNYPIVITCREALRR